MSETTINPNGERTYFCKCGRKAHESSDPIDGMPPSHLGNPVKKPGKFGAIPLTIERKIDLMIKGHTANTVLEMMEGMSDNNFAMAEPDQPELFHEHGQWWFRIKDLFFDVNEPESERTFSIVLAESDGVERLDFEEV